MSRARVAIRDARAPAPKIERALAPAQSPTRAATAPMAHEFAHLATRALATPEAEAVRRGLQGPVVERHGVAKLHVDDRAARTLDARAFTFGDHIVLSTEAATGARRPEVLAHELAHVRHQPRLGDVTRLPPQMLLASDAAFASAVPLCVQRWEGFRHAKRTNGQQIDVAYRLNRSSGDTFLDSRTGEYRLSYRDVQHLVRWHGFYFIESRGTELIAPPEVRRTPGVGAESVLIPFSSADRLAFDADPIRTVRRRLKEQLGVSPVHMTRSREADRRFASAELPRAVKEALTVGTEETRAARERAASTSQEHTLSGAARSRERLPMRPLGMSDRMSSGRFADMSRQERADWYVAKLGPLQAQLHESARRNKIPMQLLAVVILNELADINVIDVAQSGAHGFGSLGIGQVQVHTAERHHLVDPDGRRSIAERLQVPQIAVEAVAREIAILLRQMSVHVSAHQGKNFQSQHAFIPLDGAEGDAIYQHVAGETREIREANLARMVCAAYNSPDIIRTSHPSKGYSNANAHGDNARLRAFELYRAGLFRSAKPRGEYEERVVSFAVHPITEMRFDGATLTVVGGGEEKRFQAVSGLRSFNAKNPDGLDHTGPNSQDLPDVGPTLEGSFLIRPTEIERGGFPTSVWGPVRVRLHGSIMTDVRMRVFTNRTGGFHLHQDLQNDGTAGCIGLQSATAVREVFARIARTETTIPVVVKYGPLSLPQRRPKR